MRKYPLFIIDTSRSHGRGREKDFVACTSKELPFVGEISLLNQHELEIDQDWQMKTRTVMYSEPRGGIRAKLKIVSALDDDVDYTELHSLMRRCMKEWGIRMSTVKVDLDNVSNEAVLQLIDALLEQTRENARENPNDSQARTVGAILTKIKNDYTKIE